MESSTPDNRLFLSVAGVNILFESEYPLSVNQEFMPFLAEEAIPDLNANIRCVKRLPPVPQNTVYTDIFCSVSRNEDGHLQKFFFDSADNVYTVSTCDLDGFRVWIEYPSVRSPDLQSCFYCLGFEEHLLHRNRLCLHASCVDTPVGGILFSGVSGIGKSTQADLWCRYRNARQINGDRPILSREDHGWRGWGSPYAGSSKVYVNESCRISAIILLKQAPTCSVRRLAPLKAFQAVWAGLTVHSWDAAFVEKASSLTVDLVSTVPVYEFDCTPDEEAVNYLEQVLRKEMSL